MKQVVVWANKKGRLGSLNRWPLFRFTAPAFFAQSTLYIISE